MLREAKVPSRSYNFFRYESDVLMTKTPQTSTLEDFLRRAGILDSSLLANYLQCRYENTLVNIPYSVNTTIHETASHTNP